MLEKLLHSESSIRPSAAISISFRKFTFDLSSAPTHFSVRQVELLIPSIYPVVELRSRETSFTNDVLRADLFPVAEVTATRRECFDIVT